MMLTTVCQYEQRTQSAGATSWTLAQFIQFNQRRFTQVRQPLFPQATLVAMLRALSSRHLL
jgi:hypothetical protein